jgi:phosphatidate phosphatase APP1
MQTWKKKLVNLVIKMDGLADEWAGHLKHRLGSNHPVQIVPYRTYGTPERVYIKGRVLEDKKIAAAKTSDTLFTNLLNMYRRFESDEIPGATIQLLLPGETLKTTTDKEGYFLFNVTPAAPLVTEELYLNIPLQLISTPFSFTPVGANAEIMIPPADAEYGIISDIDDTIIRTGAGNILAMGKAVLLGNALTRLPFAGVAEFYKAMQLGRNGKRNNPFFYVSSSPWNLYDLLTDFMDHNNIPAGPLLLRDFGMNESFLSGGSPAHKLKEISQVLDTYPHLNFVLAGDSGEKDPPIYHEVVKRYPGRIICIYIHDVAPGKKQQIAKDIAAELKKEGVEMILTEHSAEAAKHAASIGLIFSETIPAIEQDKKEDRGEAPGKIEPELL